MKPPCCGPLRDALGPGHGPWIDAALAVPVATASEQRDLAAALVPLRGGFFDMGTRKSRFAADGDAPRRKQRVSPFAIAPTSVTNADWARFAHATGYRTIAEVDGWSSVFHMSLANAEDWPDHPPGLPWWRRVDGAFWAAPEGHGSDLDGRADHPVVHIAWIDTLAYCRWSGLRLPSEAEWEFAARGGLRHKKFPWGNAMQPGGGHAMNTWQGRFPNQNTGEDGFVSTAPVRAFAPNGYGLWNMCGNVWEWVEDAFSMPGTAPVSDARRVQRGGSYLCHESYCDRYFVHSRTSNMADSATGNAGFRVAGDVPAA